VSVQIGRLDRLITLQHVTETPDPFGQPIKTYTSYATPYARIMPLQTRSSESYKASRETAEKVYTFRIRHRSDVLAKDQIVFDGENYDVTLINPGGERTN